jgi:hypothetical protein
MNRKRKRMIIQEASPPHPLLLFPVMAAKSAADILSENAILKTPKNRN